MMKDDFPQRSNLPNRDKYVEHAQSFCSCAIARSLETYQISLSLPCGLSNRAIGLVLLGPPTDGTAPEIRRARVGFCNKLIIIIIIIIIIIVIIIDKLIIESLKLEGFSLTIFKQ